MYVSAVFLTVVNIVYVTRFWQDQHFFFVLFSTLVFVWSPVKRGCVFCAYVYSCLKYY